MRVLMVGVSSKRLGGMWSVAREYMSSEEFNDKVKMRYVATSTNGTIGKRILCMLIGYIKVLFIMIFDDIDIVHIHMAEKGSTFRKGKIAKWAHYFGKHVIIHLHAGPFMAWYNTLTEAKKEKVIEFFEYADKVAVLGQYWKKELEKIILPEKMVVLYNGVSIPNANTYNSDAKNIVYFGVMNQAKGIFDLLDAIKRIDAKLDNGVKVILCGNDLTRKIDKMVLEYGLEERIHLLGWVDLERRREIFNDAAINVLPSYYEGLSMTVIEAMAAGIPVVTTNISTMPELLGSCEYLIKPGDVENLGNTILKLINEKNIRIKMSEEEYYRAKTFFSTDSFINNTIALYQNVLRGN